MKYINEVLKLSIEDKREQIKLRYALIETMVGTLYPSIILSEIDKIRQSIK